MTMKRNFIGIIVLGMLLYLTGCGGTASVTKSFVRENTSLALIQTVAVLPFEGGGRASRIREFTMTQLLAMGVFDVVDKGRVDSVLQQEALAPGTPLDVATIRRLGQLLKAEAIIFGSVEEILSISS